MLFSPNLKRKRGVKKWIVNPFPTIEPNKKYEGIYTGISVEVCASGDIASLYDNGFYGKGSQSRSAPQSIVQNVNSSQLRTEVNESLCLGLEESFFLAYYLKVLRINDFEQNEIGYERFLLDCLNVNKAFIETLTSYMYLKSKGWVVKSGMKFGGDYLIYRMGPRFYHASFVVVIVNSLDKEHLHSKNFKGLQRIAETSDKDVLFLEVDKPRNFKLLRVESISNVKISEMIIRRFNYSSYVQNQNGT